MPGLSCWFPLLLGYSLLLGSLGLLRGAGSPRSTPPVSWPLVQHRSASHGCLGTTRVRTWQRGEQDIRSSNLTYGKKAELLVENGLQLRMYDVLLNNKKVLTQQASRTRQRITARSVQAPVRAVGLILKRTPRLLIISWLPGSIGVYQNTALGRDSVPNRVLNGYVLTSGQLAGRPLTYCP